MLGLEAVVGMKEEFEEGRREKSSRKCELGMAIKLRFYGKARPINLY